MPHKVCRQLSHIESPKYAHGARKLWRALFEEKVYHDVPSKYGLQKNKLSINQIILDTTRSLKSHFFSKKIKDLVISRKDCNEIDEVCVAVHSSVVSKASNICQYLDVWAIFWSQIIYPQSCLWTN